MTDRNIVYTIRSCPFCVRAKGLLQEMGVDYEEVLIEDREEMMKLKETYGWRTFPMIIINGNFLGGFQDVQSLVERGEFEEAVSGASSL